MHAGFLVGLIVAVALVGTALAFAIKSIVKRDAEYLWVTVIALFFAILATVFGVEANNNGNDTADATAQVTEVYGINVIELNTTEETVTYMKGDVMCDAKLYLLGVEWIIPSDTRKCTQPMTPAK